MIVKERLGAVTGRAEPRLLRALNRRGGSTIPVWVMYPGLRSSGICSSSSMQEIINLRSSPWQRRSLPPVTEESIRVDISVEQVTDLHVDAATACIDFSALIRGAGAEVWDMPQQGPTLVHPFDNPCAIASLASRGDIDFDAVRKTVSDISTALHNMSNPTEENAANPIVAICPSPYSLASFLVEGYNSRDHLKIRALAYSDLAAWNRLMEWCTAAIEGLLRAQVDAGAQVIQIVDQAARTVCQNAYLEYLLPYNYALTENLSELDVPVTYYMPGCGDHLHVVKELKITGIGCEYGQRPTTIAERTDGKFAVQCNVDPALYAAPWPVIAERLGHVVADGKELPGFVLNLGESIPRTVSISQLRDVTDLIHSL